jgi:hypothetical protein
MKELEEDNREENREEENSQIQISHFDIPLFIAFIIFFFSS